MDKLHCTIGKRYIESSAIEQIDDILKNPRLISLAIMPDVHTGYTLPIGGVADMQGVIVPEFVGTDICCSVMHYNTGIQKKKLFKSRNNIESVYEKIRDAIPVGKLSHSTLPKYNYDELGDYTSKIMDMSTVKEINDIAKFQIGTLGGGNHFIEIGYNSKDEIAITVHSGSRRPGALIFNYFSKEQPKELDIKSIEGMEYFNALNYCHIFSTRNKHFIINQILEILELPKIELTMSPSRGKEYINICHNQAQIKNYDGLEVVRHYKGACPCAQDEYAVIPANQLNGTYIVKGKGCKEYMEACSHGCGRKMSRAQAKKRIDLDRFKEQMNDIICRTDINVIDEAPDAYKKPQFVIETQVDLGMIEVVDHFTPLLVVKG